MTAITALTTNTKVKSLLGITASTDDALLTMIAGWVTDFIGSLCGRKLTDTVVTNEYFDGDDFNHFLRVDNYPVTEWTKVEEETSDGVFSVMDPDDYETYNDSGVIYFYGHHPGKKNIRLSYKTGLGTLPLDLEMLATRLTAKIYQKRKSEGVSQEQLADANVQWADFLKDEDKAIINSYKMLAI